MARILITNDDGIDAPGISVLATAVADAGHDVVVAAPLAESSGSGAAIGHLVDGTRIRIEPRRLDPLSHVSAFGVEGPPARCVFLAFLEAFGPRPDLVVSGINPGLNTGRGLLHSGTVGAVLAAGDFGISAMAISLDVEDLATARWDTAAEIARRAVPVLLDAPRKTVLNINVPDRSFADVAGVRHARIAAFGSSATSLVREDDTTLRVVVRPREVALKPDTDTALVAEGFVAVTSIITPRAVDPGATADALADAVSRTRPN
jgi:5'-nucleotidase